MHRLAPAASRTLATLHRHAIVLLPQLLARLMLGLVMSIVGVLHDAPILVVVCVLVVLLLSLYAWMAWRVYSVRVRYDRIIVRRLRYGGIQEDMYPIPGRNGMQCRQTWVGRRMDMGTITIYLPSRTVRLTMLTPYSATARVLGLDG